MNEFSTMKTLAYAAPTSYIRNAARMLREAGYDVKYDSKAGTMVASFTEGDKTVVVARALQMGKFWSLRANPKVMAPAPAA